MNTNHKKNGQKILTVGLFVLAISTYLLTKLNMDFISGIGYGIAIGLLIWGIAEMKKTH